MAERLANTANVERRIHLSSLPHLPIPCTMTV